MNKKNSLPFLLLILIFVSTACGTKFESLSIDSNTSKAINGPDEIPSEGSNPQPDINPPEVVAPDVVPPLVDIPTTTPTQPGDEVLTQPQIRERLKNTFYKQVDSAINIQSTSKQNRPGALPICKNIDQLTSLFGCSMYSISGLRQTQKLTADIKIYLADPSKKTIDKVAFIVASHNFENPVSINHEARYTSHPSGAKKIYDELALKGVSVVFIGFGYKEFYLNSIFDKAQATARVIKLINSLKTTKDPSFLIGLSLGGVIGRMAINSLETTGENLHNVNHYVSFDSPHRGAHVPMSLQHIMQFLEDGANKAKSVAENFQDQFGNLIDDILDLDGLADQLETGIEGANFFSNQVKLFSGVYLNSDFAQELVIQQISKEQSTYIHPAYTRLQNHLDTSGMPKLTKSNIGVTNGSITGTSLPLVGNQYVSLDTNKTNHIEVDFISYIAKSSAVNIFQGMFRYPDPKELGGLFGGDGTDKFNYVKAQNNNIADLDRSTCGYLNAVGDIEKVIAAQLKKMFAEPLVITNHKACFINTSSGLASRKSITYKGPMTAQDSLFDEIIGGRTNTHHLSFTTEISNGILDIVKKSY